MSQMVKCPNPNCGAMVPQAKFYCPNCSKPMVAEEQRASGGGRIQDMAATVVGFSIANLPDGVTQTLVMPKQNPPPPEPQRPAPPPAQRPVTPPPVQANTGGSKTVLFVIGGLVALFVLLALAVIALVALGFISFG